MTEKKSDIIGLSSMVEPNKNEVSKNKNLRHENGRWSTKYDQKYDEMLVNHLAEGGTKKSFAGMIGVTRQTLDAWSKTHESFGLAYRHGKEKSFQWWLDLGRKLAMGEVKGNGIVYNFIMSNLFRWHNKHELDKPEDANVSIQFIRDTHKKTIEMEQDKEDENE